MLIRRIMEKYLCIRFKLYYFLTTFIFFIYPFLLILREIIFFTNEDKSMFNQTISFFMAIFLCFLYMIVIIPTVQLLKMNSKEKYWYSDVFKKNKVYGNIRIAIKINSIIFIVIQILICFFNFFNNQSPVSEFFWMPLVVFMLFFGVYAIMAGIHLEIKNNQGQNQSWDSTKTGEGSVS